MQAGFRFLIVCFIALALPVQGLASVTMAHCMPSDPRLPVAMSASAHHHLAGPDTDAAAQRRGAAVTSGAGIAVTPADAAAAPAHALSDISVDLAQNKCSACASCCAAAALPRVMPRVPEPLGAPQVFAEITVSVQACAADGPDRPPRG